MFMGFLKGFGIGLVVFLALNFVFSLIVAAVDGAIGFFFISFVQWENFFYVLLGPITTAPWVNLFGLELGGTIFVDGLLGASVAGDIALILQYIFAIVSPLIASILTGRFAGGKRFAFLAWFLISILSGALLLIPELLNAPFATIEIYGIITLITLIPSVINGVFYAPFGMAVSEAEFY